ncbi:hypothetical protein [Ensifer sp. MJa1]|uniref:hypothetical protein n=1 Tax=Ensifer sp. MJa1 TaxID=2919888 RepID=UPI00300B5220
MKKSIAAALVATAVVGAASAAVAGGNSHENARFVPRFMAHAEASAGTGVSASSAGLGDYDAAMGNRSIDATATGAITAGHAKDGENNQ